MGTLQLPSLASASDLQADLTCRLYQWSVVAPDPQGYFDVPV